jgi:uncharacterized protein (DUF1697 family)
MSFRVVWQYKVIRELTSSYVYARMVGRDTDALVRAMARLDAILERNPTTAGESREEQVRVLIVNPLTVYFEVYEDEQVVLITAMRYHRRDI